MQRLRTLVARRGTWSPGWRLRTVLLATTAGSVFGLVFGLGSLNRPILNAVIFYFVGALVAALIAGLAVLAVRSRHGGRLIPPSQGAERAPRRAPD
jgi:hypothetical protein